MKIIGKGLIAKAFMRASINYQGIIFASGVSNSKEEKSSSFNRETELLKKWLDDSKSLVYFSTCSIDDPSVNKSDYVEHKLNMEMMVLKKSSNYVIRLPQVVGKSTNKNTVIGYLAYKIFTSEPYELYKGTIRNLIDIDHVVLLTSILLGTNNNPGPHSFAMPFDYSIDEIVSILEKVLEKKSKHNIVKTKGFHYPCSTFIRKAIEEKEIECTEDYLETIIRKYYTDYPSGF